MFLFSLLIWIFSAAWFALLVAVIATCVSVTDLALRAAHFLPHSIPHARWLRLLVWIYGFEYWITVLWIAMYLGWQSAWLSLDLPVVANVAVLLAPMLVLLLPWWRIDTSSPATHVLLHHLRRGGVLRLVCTFGALLTLPTGIISLLLVYLGTRILRRSVGDIDQALASIAAESR